MNPNVTGTDLVYNIVERRLVGAVGGERFDAQAGSGGRAGSKKHDENPFLANNPYATGVKAYDSKRPGGPLAMARYRLRTHESRGNWIRLQPMDGEALHGRSGFAIHGRGKEGSHGCIVPTDFNVVVRLYNAIKKLEAQNAPAPTLAVVAIGDLDSVDRRLDRLSRTA